MDFPALEPACHHGLFLQQKDQFLTLSSHGFMAQWAWNGFKPCPHMGQECSGWKGSQSEHNCVTDTKKSAKTGQNWPKIAQTMAIFHHKWLILWRKKIIFINIQLPMGSGQLLIPFGYLEVPLPAACSLVRRAFWNRPAPFFIKIYFGQRYKIFQVRLVRLHLSEWCKLQKAPGKSPPRMQWYTMLATQDVHNIAKGIHNSA